MLRSTSRENACLEQVVDPYRRKGWFDNVIIKGFSVRVSSVVHAIPEQAHVNSAGFDAQSE